MKLMVVVDAHIVMTPDKKHWCQTIYSYSFFQRYLSTFDDIRVVARVKPVDKLDGKYQRVDGDYVEVYGIPFYQGPIQLLKRYLVIQKSLMNIDAGCDAALFRMPEQTCQMAYRHMRKCLPFACEVVYDPSDDLKQSKSNFLLYLLHLRISYNLREICLRANGVSYVTEHTIQENFPCYAQLHGETKDHFTSAYSTITLSDESFTGPRVFKKDRKFTLALCDAAMNSERKGERIFIHAIQRIRAKGYDVAGIIIGDGSMRPSFEQLAQELGIADSITFTGLVANADEVRGYMKEADLFVLPTQAEGLPRGILEAMALGMPVLSTPVGGIPEILERKYLFTPTDIDGLTAKICELINDTSELEAMSIANYSRAKEFSAAILQNKRNEFYKKLRLLAEEKNRQ